MRLQDGMGCTPLHVAVRAGAHAITRLLVCWCVELLHVRNAAGRTPLHDAIIKGDEEMVRLLLECGADPAAVFPAAATQLTSAYTENVQPYL